MTAGHEVKKMMDFILKKFPNEPGNIDWEKQPHGETPVDVAIRLLSEPRYSVAELEKLFSVWCYSEEIDDNKGSAAEFVDFLKDRKKVEEILEGEK